MRGALGLRDGADLMLSVVVTSMHPLDRRQNRAGQSHPTALHPVPRHPIESGPDMTNDLPHSAFSNSGPGWTPPPPLAQERERFTENVHTLLTPSTKAAWLVWAGKRSMGSSAAVRALIEDALWREVRGEPLGALYGDLPASMAHHIVAASKPPESAPEA